MTNDSDRYLALIEEIITITLQGKIRSKHQVYRMLVENLSVGTGEIFERCLDERLTQIQEILDSQTDEMKQAKATRQLRALQTIQDAWQQWQKERQQTDVMAKAVEQVRSAPVGERFLALLQILDINQKNPFTPAQIQQLAKSLERVAEEDLQQLATGLTRGLASIALLEGHLVSWMYEQGVGTLGFEGVPGQKGPWSLWAGLVNSLLPQQLFQLQSFNRPATELAQSYQGAELSAWVELAVVLRWLQQSLVAWFDRQPYSVKWGRQLSCATLMAFAGIWWELSDGLRQANRMPLSRVCFQMVLQILRNFAGRADFPLYGGIFASFSGEGLRDALRYLDEPLREIERTQEKGRILTLMGYSQRTMGQYERANEFHREALEIARSAGDSLCEIANFNHLSRIAIAQKDYQLAIDYSQRALIMARQTGDKLGEANALANLGYGEVLATRQQEQILPEVYETSIAYLKQSLVLSERMDDAYTGNIVRYQTQALAYNSLGIAYTLIEQPTSAIAYLEKGIEAAQTIGDLYLAGLNYTYLAEAYYRLNELERAVCNGCLGMFFLERISAREWRQSAGLLSILQGQMGAEAFQSLLQQNRAKIVIAIGVDGFDYLPQLLEQYRSS